MVSDFQNSNHVTISNDVVILTYYSDKCKMEFHKNILIFDENSSVEEIAQELTAYNGSTKRSFEYGDIEGACIEFSNKKNI